MILFLLTLIGLGLIMDLRATYSLVRLKKLIVNSETRLFTRPSMKDAMTLGFSETEMVDTVLSLEELNFYKTMPSNDSMTIWQDVYHTTAKGSELYIKLQEVPKSRCVIISFKEK